MVNNGPEIAAPANFFRIPFRVCFRALPKAATALLCVKKQLFPHCARPGIAPRSDLPPGKIIVLNL